MIEAADPVEVDYIAEADRIEGIVVRARVETAAEMVDIADFSSPAALDSSVLCKWAIHRRRGYTA